MKTKINFPALFAVIFLLTTQACKKDKDAEPAFSQNIQKIVSQATIDSLRGEGMVINEGTKPPKLEGIYLATPYVLVSTYKEDPYDIGYLFSDFKLKISGQDDKNLGVTIQIKNAGAVGNGVGAFVSGSDNKFTIFAEIDLVDGNATAKQIRIFSGEIVDGGIKNFYSSLYIKEKNDPSGRLIPVAQGRIMMDKDGMTEKTDEFRIGAETANSPTQNNDTSLSN